MKDEGGKEEESKLFEGWWVHPSNQFLDTSFNSLQDVKIKFSFHITVVKDLFEWTRHGTFFNIIKGLGSVKKKKKPPTPRPLS